jgi:hemerythrin-like metal-binding protein
MKFILWTPEMSVGSEVLDGHHRIIVDCLNLLHPLLDGDAGGEAEIQQVLSKLEEFILVHFSEEEQAIRKAGYPDWRAHKEQHDKMYDVVYALKSDVEHGKRPDARHLFEMINGWLVNHILGEDKKYVPYLANPTPNPTATWTRSNGREY